MSYSRRFLLPYFLVVLTGILAESSHIIAPITGSQVITRLCGLRAETLFWRVNNTVAHHGTWGYLKAIGFTFPDHDQSAINGTLMERVQINISPEYKNNNSVLYCIGHISNDQQINSSATLIIADVPLPPNPVASILRKNSIHVRWEPPYSWRDFPITNYTLSLELPSRGYQSVVLSPDQLSYNTTMDFSATSCAKANFSIYATSEVGRSDSRIVSIDLPAAPGMFVEPPKTKVTFDKQGVPQVDITFIFPFVCPHNLAAYLLRIKDKDDRLIHFDGPHVISWNASGSQVAMKVSGTELTGNFRYSAELSVSTLGGHSSITFDIVLGAASSNLNSFLGAIVGGVCALLVLVAIVIVMSALCWRRKLKLKQREVPHWNTPIYEEIVSLQNAQPDMVRPPNERDEGYTSIRSTPTSIKSPCEKTDSLEENNKDHSSEDGYMTMNPIGAIITQMIRVVGDTKADKNGRPNQYR